MDLSACFCQHLSLGNQNDKEDVKVLQRKLGQTRKKEEKQYPQGVCFSTHTVSFQELCII